KITNVDELFDHLVELCQHPREKADTVTVMEKIGHFLDRENDRLFREHKETTEDNRIISQLIHRDLDLGAILKESGKRWDGGYVMCGMIGHGDAFVIRDPNGIRPCYVYKDEEVIVIASERPVIQTVFNVPYESVKELPEGHAAIIKKDGTYREELIVEPGERKACSFERIYFSRGNDAEIYSERKALGKNLTDAVLRAINYDLKNTVFSYIPNTAEIAFHGLVEGLNEFADKEKLKTLQSKKNLSEDELKSVLSFHPRVNKVILKDAKQRTFITADESRDSLVNLGYDISYGTIVSGKDTLVVLDDSIVRGTTLKKSILSILDRLKPKKIIVVSSAPQIRYPDCYGIDMAVLGKFVAFDACMALLKDRNMEDLIDQVYQEAKAELEKPKEEQVNVVDKLYKAFTTEEISKKIAELIRPSNLNAELEIIYQSIEGLHNACPNHLGDWYFTGKFPTPGGVRVSNRSFVNYMEGKNVRAY
ncbi:MAG: amidophosphoribosyltransferase, partial [Bacteroidia bacterium]